MSDLEIAQRLAAGDPEAFERAVQDHRAAILAFLRHLTRRPEDAEDLTQETLLRARRAAGRYDGRAGLRTWLLRIAYREFLRWRRTRPWLPLLERQAVEPAFGAVADAEWLLGLLTRLSVPLRTAFLLHEVQGLSVEEIAEVTNAPSGTVKYRLHEARKRLREYGTEPNERLEVKDHVLRSEA